LTQRVSRTHFILTLGSSVMFVGMILACLCTFFIQLEFYDIKA